MRTSHCHRCIGFGSLPYAETPQRETPSPWTEAGLFDKDLHPVAPMNRITNTCENMTCPQVRLQAVQINTWNCGSFSPSTNVCQYVVVLFFICQCVHSSACEQNKWKKQWELFSTSPISRLSISVWWCLSLSINVWLRTPANATQSINIWMCSSFNLPRHVCQYVVMLFFSFHCVDANTCQLNSK